MKRPVFLFVFAIFTISFWACSSGKKAFERGDYQEAVYKSLNRLQSSPGNDKAAETFQAAYPSFVKYFEDQVRQEEIGSSPFKWERILSLYESLNAVYDEVQRTPATRGLIRGVRSYHEEAEEVREKAAAARYAMGEEALESGYREDAREAHQHFEKVSEIYPRYKEVDEMLEKALMAATLWVQVKDIPMQSARYEVSSEFFESQVMEYLRERRISPYVQFLGPESSKNGRSPRPDHILELNFEDFVVGQVYERELQADRSKDSVVLGTTRLGDSTVNTYGTVKARLFGFEKEISSSGILRLRVKDTYSEDILTENEFAGTFVWYDYWGYVEGDKRALDADDEKYLARRRPGPEPDPQTMFIEFTRPIYDQVTRYLEDYYERY